MFLIPLYTHVTPSVHPRVEGLSQGYPRVQLEYNGFPCVQCQKFFIPYDDFSYSITLNSAVLTALYVPEP